MPELFGFDKLSFPVFNYVNNIIFSLRRSLFFKLVLLYKLVFSWIR